MVSDCARCTDVLVDGPPTRLRHVRVRRAAARPLLLVDGDVHVGLVPVVDMLGPGTRSAGGKGPGMRPRAVDDRPFPISSMTLVSHRTLTASA